MPFSNLANLSLASETIRAKTFSVSLQSRYLGRADSLPDASWAAVLLEEGEATLLSPSNQEAFSAPAIFCLPWNETMRIAIKPGTSGVFLNLSSDAMQSAAGYRAESNELRRMFERRIHHSLHNDPELRSTVETCLNEIVVEARKEEAATRTVSEAYLRILLVRLWRSVTADINTKRPSSPQVDLYNRFITLVQQHFRERWTVSDYAQKLGISRDRLGDICRSSGGQTPKHAIDARVAIEAKLLIEHSTNSIEQISSILGFPSPSHFTRFFIRMTGVPPSRYRNERMWADTGRTSPNKAAMHEWP